MVRAEVERRLATVLSAEIVGFRDEDGAIGTDARKSDRGMPLSSRIAEYRGRLVGRRDGTWMAEFAGVPDAVRFAAAVQLEQEARNAVLQADRRIAWRIGVNLGDVVDDGDGIHGTGVAFADRLKELAEPGGVCVSAVAYDQVTSVIGPGGVTGERVGGKHRIAAALQWSALLAYFFGWFALIAWKNIHYALYKTWPCWPGWMCG